MRSCLRVLRTLKVLDPPGEVDRLRAIELKLLLSLRDEVRSSSKLVLLGEVEGLAFCSSALPQGALGTSCGTLVGGPPVVDHGGLWLG
jgi:hypothetical protein